MIFFGSCGEGKKNKERKKSGGIGGNEVIFMLICSVARDKLIRNDTVTPKLNIKGMAAVTSRLQKKKCNVI